MAEECSVTFIMRTLRVQGYLNETATLRKKVMETKFKAGKNVGTLSLRSSMPNGA
jgi:hypothetical protein